MYFLHTSSHLFLQGCSVKRDSLAFFNATNNSLSFFPALQISAAPIMPKSLHFFAVFMSKIFLISESPSHYCAQQELKNVLSRNYSNFQKKSSKFFFFFQNSADYYVLILTNSSNNQQCLWQFEHTTFVSATKMLSV